MNKITGDDFMNNRKTITTLEADELLDEARILFGNISLACDYVIYASEPDFKAEHNTDRLRAFLSVLSFAADAACAKLLEFGDIVDNPGHHQ
jgi:hypothetical protein